MITGRSAPASSAAASSTPAGGCASRRSSARRDLELGLAEDDVHRIVDEGRAARRGGGEVERAGGQRRDRVGRLRRLGRLDQRRDERQVVDLLQRARPPAHLRRPPAEHRDRRVVRLRAGDRAHPVGDARPGGQRRDPDPAGRLGDPLGGEGGGLLVADVDDPDPLGFAAVIYGEDVPAREREQRVHPRDFRTLATICPPCSPMARHLICDTDPCSARRRQKCPGRDSNPRTPYGIAPFKGAASTSFATRARRW